MLHSPDRLNTENISFTLNSACCSMCLSKYVLETVLKSHCKHWNCFPEQTKNVFFNYTHKYLPTDFYHTIRIVLITSCSFHRNKNKTSKEHQVQCITEWSVPTFICVAQSVALQRHLWFELFTTQITKVASFAVVSVHVSLQVAPAAACVVAHVASIRLQTCTHGHTF